MKRRAVWQIDIKVRQKPVRSIYIGWEKFVIILSKGTANSSQSEVSSTHYTVLHPQIPQAPYTLLREIKSRINPLFI
jgi:hypothetical protein